MASSGEHIDPAMLDLFRAELDIHLPVLGEGLLALEKEGHQPKLLEAMMRAAHSIKGAARIVGVDAAVRVAHVMEDCFVAAQKGEIRLTTEATDVLLRGFDFLTRLAQSGAGGDTLDAATIQKLVEEISAVREAPAAAEPPKKALPPAPAPESREPGTEQGRALALREPGLAGGASEHPAGLPRPVPGGHRQVPVAPLPVVRAVEVLAAERSQVVHDRPRDPGTRPGLTGVVLRLPLLVRRK